MSVLAGTQTILRAELRAYTNRLRKSSRVRLAALAIALLAAIVFLGGSVFSLGIAAGHFLPSGLDSFIVGGFTVLAVVMLLLGFPTVIGSLFVGRDLLLLILAPVRTVEIFAARILFAMTANTLLSAVLLTFILGLGIGAGASPVYFVLAPLLIGAEVLVVTALQAILMSVVLRWAPARLARDVAAAVAAITGAAFYLTWNLTLRSTFSTRGARPDVSSLGPLTQRVDWLPSAWPAHALSAIATGQAGAVLAWTLATLALTALVTAAAALLYERTLLAGLGVFGSTPTMWRRASRRERGSAPDRRAPVGIGVASPILAIVRKDWLAYRRDIRRLTRLLPALLFMVGYAVALSRPSQFAGGFWAGALLVTFLALFMSNVVGLPSVPSEHRGFQILRMAPLTMGQVLRAKVLATLPPVAVLLVGLAVVIAVVGHSPAAELIELVVFVFWLASGFVGISVGAGGIDPKFDALDDRRAVGVGGSLAGLGASVAFAALSLGALALFVLGAGVAGGVDRLGPFPVTPVIGAGMLAGGVVVAAGAAAVVWLLLWTASTRLATFEATISTT